MKGFALLPASIYLLMYAMAVSPVVRSQSYDSTFSLPANTKRLLMVEEKIIHLRTQREGNTFFCQAVLQKGTDAERCYTRLTLERGSLNGFYSAADVAVTNRYLQSAKELNDPALLAIIYYVLADIHLNRRDYNNAFENYLYCYDQLKADPEGRHFNQSWFLYDIAFQHYLFKDYDRAIGIGKAACRLPPKPWHGPWAVSISTNLVAMASLKAGQTDTALVWLQKTYSNALRMKDTAWLGIATGNRGIIHLQQKRFGEAADQLQRGIDLCRTKALWDNVARFSVHIAELHLQQGNPAKAAAALIVADAALGKSPDIESSYSYYHTATNYYRQTGNYQSAVAAMDSADAYNKKLQAEFNSNKKILAESNLVFEKQGLAVQMANQKVTQERWIRYALLATLLLLGAVGVLFFKRQKLRHLLKQERLEMETLKAEEEVHNAKMQLQEFKRHAVQESRLLEHFIKEVERLKLKTETVPDEHQQSIEELKRNTVLTDEDWNVFRTSFEKVHPGFLARLKERYPSLTPAEVRYAVFTKLKMAPKEMTTVLGISAEGLRNIRFRLRKKIVADAEADLETLIEEVA